MQQFSAPAVRRPLSGRYDAQSLARSLASSGLAWCWLDGESPAAGEQPTSYFGITETVFECERGNEAGFLDELRTRPSRRQTPPHQTSLTAGAGFHAGWVLALSYEFGVALAGLPPAPDDAPPAFALRLDAVLALTETSLELRADSDQALAAWLASYGHLLTWASHTLDAHAPSVQATPAWRRSGAAYEAQIATCQRAIAAGDSYVICLTDTARLAGSFDPIDVYARLRASGSATRGGVICHGSRALISASPERFLSIHDRTVYTRPIKGTRPRGTDEASDRALAAALARDPKERAENLMIVDLMRNDLHRVCDPGSVRVSEFLRVEPHPHVHQLVSSVTGELAAGRDAIDAIAACFPAGSMTGAPKRRAMELLGEIEAAPRGLYSGCFGWLDSSGDAELAMTIRGVELREMGSDGAVALVGAGGGITADSNASAERAEKDLKARAVLAALRAVDAT